MPKICDWAAGLLPSHLRLEFIVLTRRIMPQLGSYPFFYNGEARKAPGLFGEGSETVGAMLARSPKRRTKRQCTGQIV